MTRAYLGIGSNVGERASFCRKAIEALRENPSIEVVGVSSLYETEPVGGPPQRSFINCAVAVDTELEPHDLLDICKSLEQRLGREPSDIKWGPRVVDIDILLYGEEKVSEPDLEIPHARMSERRFVLIPLLEIAPDAADPWGGRYADALDDAEGSVELSEPF